MTLARPEIDQLIEEGLTRYGHGDFDGALVSWEQVLELDPKHERASSYVDYVKMNYEVLRSELAVPHDAPPFTIAADADDEYHIEITTGEREAGNKRKKSGDPLDKSWILDEDTGFAPPLSFEIDADSDGEETLDAATEIRADVDGEPDDEAEIEIQYEEPAAEVRDSGDIAFDAATREYTGARAPVSEANPREDAHAHDFGAQVTDIRPRELGFVQPARPSHGGRTSPVGTDADPDMPTQERPPIVSAPTRDLGIRPGGPRRATTTSDEEPTEIRVVRVAARGTIASAAEAPRHADIVWALDPIDASSAEILESIDEGSPRNEPRDERTRRRITALFERADTWSKTGELDRAVTAVDLALSEDPNTALAQKLILRHRETIMAVFQAFLGDLHRAPALARPLHELGAAPISPRAAFLLSRIDGVLSLEEILDVSGMPQLEAHRYLCQLFLRGILHMR